MPRLLFSKAFKAPERGFSYVGLLALIAIMGVVSAAAVQLGMVTHRRVAEEALLDVGREFSQALESYRRMTPPGKPDAPLELHQLLRDDRFPAPVRHQRKLYADPLTGKAEWGLVRADEDKRILGIFSLSEAKPVKVANFEMAFQEFVGKASYKQWIFRAQSGAPQIGGIGVRKGPSSPRDLMPPMSLSEEPESKPSTVSPPPAGAGGLISPMDVAD